LSLQRPRRALSTLDTLAETYPPGSVPRYVVALRGMSLKKLGRYEAAVEVLSEANRSEFPDPQLLYELAEAQWLSGDVASAKVALQAALAKSPNSPQALHLQQQIQLASNRIEPRTAR
jgi:predicted Zn-dependent protease